MQNLVLLLFSLVLPLFATVLSDLCLCRQRSKAWRLHLLEIFVMYFKFMHVSILWHSFGLRHSWEQKHGKS
jgi:hypothetical protein